MFITLFMRIWPVMQAVERVGDSPLVGPSTILGTLKSVVNIAKPALDGLNSRLSKVLLYSDGDWEGCFEDFTFFRPAYRSGKLRPD